MPSDGSGTLKGFTFVFTGSLENFSRKGSADAARALGAKVTGNVSARTDYLVVGTKPGSKVKKAKEINVYIINEDEFTKIIRGELPPKSDRRKARSLASHKAKQDLGLSIPIEDNDIADLKQMHLPAVCKCGREFRRIMRRGTQHAWVCDGQHETAKMERYALYTRGYERIDR